MAIKPLSGTVTLPKSVFSADIWLCEPFSRGQALADLWSMANDRQRTIKIRGVDVTLKRGQCGPSLQTLAERWRCSRDKVRAILAELQDAREITFESSNLTTIITVLDYCVYNADTTPETAAEPTAETTANPTAEPTQKRGSGEDGRGEERESARAPETLISKEMALDWWKKNAQESDYTQKEVEDAWSYFHQSRDISTGQWRIGQTCLTDWRHALERQIQRSRTAEENRAKKNPAPPRAVYQGEAPLPPVASVNFEAMKAVV